MSVSRYNRTVVLNFGAQYGTSNAIQAIRQAIVDGRLNVREVVVRGAERLDTLAGETYGEGRYWWILAAASDIGWGLQIPPGTIIKIPQLDQVLALIG